VIVGASLGVTAFTFWGIGGAVHWWFYVRRREEAASWKIQPKRWLGARMSRHAFLLGSANILMGSVIGGTFAWHIARGGWSMLYFDARAYGLWYLPVSALLLFFAIDAGLYYSHRWLHGRTMFRLVHRWHHRYTAPIVFTATAVHPFEFLTFEAFLILPALLIPAHVAVYVAVIAYTYFIGMVDHAGVRLRWPLPLHANNQFHDDHHVFFHCNYAHHTMLFDKLHGTIRRADRRYDEATFGGRGAAREDAPNAKPEAVRY
jgi:lathosterol oxidase